MNLPEIKQEAYKLSVSDRLALIEAIVQSLMNELETTSLNLDTIVTRVRAACRRHIAQTSQALQYQFYQPGSYCKTFLNKISNLKSQI